MYNVSDEEQNAYTFEVSKFMTVFICYEHLRVNIRAILARGPQLFRIMWMALGISRNHYLESTNHIEILGSGIITATQI